MQHCSRGKETPATVLILILPLCVIFIVKTPAHGNNERQKQREVTQSLSYREQASHRIQMFAVVTE